MLLLLLSTSSLLSLAPTRVGAQGTASFVGIVLNDADRTPIGNARVMLTDLGREIRSDEDGRFSLTDLPSGWLSLRVERDDFVTLVESVGLVPDEASTIQVHLRRVTALLDSLLVGTPGPGWRERGHSEGRIAGGDTDMRTAADLLLTSVPGLSARRPDGARGTGVNVQLRGVRSIVLSDQPHIYMDGIRIDGGGADGALLVLDQISASAVKRIRVLRGPASVSMYPNAAAGVILIETSGPGS